MLSKDDKSFGLNNYGYTNNYINTKLSQLGMNKDWLIGFIEGEGCFHYLYSGKDNKTKYGVFSISQKDKEILSKIKDFFNCGHIYKIVTDGVYEFRIYKQKDLMNVVKLYNKGFSCNKIADKLNCSATTVYNKLKLLNISLRNKSDANKKFDIFSAWHLYNLGLSFNQFGVILSIDASTVSKRFKKSSLPVRDRNVAQKIRYSHDEFHNFFIEGVK